MPERAAVTKDLPAVPSLLCVERGSERRVALWRDNRLTRVEHHFDDLMRMSAVDMRKTVEASNGETLDLREWQLAAPVESQEVWACGVTYLRSRSARMEESQTRDVYARVYEAERPEIFFKSAGWRVVGHRHEVGIRPDSAWNVPEPELAVLANAAGEVVAYACGNDMSSRSIEGENPLYLPQAKVYDRSCSIGPAAVPAWRIDLAGLEIRMLIDRGGQRVYDGRANVADMVRDPLELAAVLFSAYPLPAGAWLLTGTPLVPPPSYTALAGDRVTIQIDGLGRLVNHVATVPHSAARALPRIAR